jgi:N-methylhydantoinase B
VSQGAQPLERGHTVLTDGETAEITTAGSGGYGSPHERSPEDVLRDVHEGKVSLQTAREEYGLER